MGSIPIQRKITPPKPLNDAQTWGSLVDVAELVDALGLGSSEVTRGGSSPLIDTGFQNSNLNSMISEKKFPPKNRKKS